MQQCEDLEDTESLHNLYRIMKGAVLLNDISLLELLFSDRHVMDVVRLGSHLQPAGAVTWTCCRGVADGRADCLIAGDGHSAVLPQLRPVYVDTAVPRPLAGSALAAPVTGRAAIGTACRLGVLVQHTS